MNILQLLGKKKQKKNLGVCIPTARKQIAQKAAEEPSLTGPLPDSTVNAFFVEGVFAVHDSISLQGKMVQGTTRIGNLIEIKGKELLVKDISVEKKPVDCIHGGERGTLFLLAKYFPIIRQGDTLEF